MKIKILTTKNDLQKQITLSILKKLTARLEGARDVFEGILRTYVKNTIKNTEVWQSLSGNSETGLDAHFGIPASENEDRLKELMNIWLKQIKVRVYKPKKIGGVYQFRVKLFAIHNDWKEISDASAGKTFSKPSQETLAWMDWLLNGKISLSDKITNYDIKFDISDKEQHKSRSKKAIMVLSKTSSYNFPVDLVGGEPNATDNFIIRAFEATIANNNIILRDAFIRTIINAIK